MSHYGKNSQIMKIGQITVFQGLVEPSKRRPRRQRWRNITSAAITTNSSTQAPAQVRSTWQPASHSKPLERTPPLACRVGEGGMKTPDAMAMVISLSCARWASTVAGGSWIGSFRREFRLPPWAAMQAGRMRPMADSKIDPDSLPQVVLSATNELTSLRPSLVENALTQALPLPDIMFGGSVLIAVIMFHAFWIRVITSSFLKRTASVRVRASMWRADALFMVMMMSLLALHLAEVVLWSAALVFGDITAGWSNAAYFAANCYTALGEPFSLPRAWRMVPPIIAMSGIFTFAWTASVLVNFVARYNELRLTILARGVQHKGDAAPAVRETVQ
jgi:hypothetical protein